VALYGRYVYGLTDINRTGNPATAPKVYMQGVQAGIKLRLTGRRVYADRDGDGLLDRQDKCPTVVGLAKYAGCPVPDGDRDGLADDIDACPSQAGDAAFRGCPPPPPPPDRDADGVIDAQDRCPTVAGEREFDGCPDTDHDGYEDARDKCPTIPGAVLPRGCPRLDGYRPSAVTFEPGTARLTAEGRTEGGGDNPTDAVRGPAGAWVKEAFSQ
jgi:hypothetical protein